MPTRPRVRVRLDDPPTRRERVRLPPSDRIIKPAKRIIRPATSLTLLDAVADPLLFAGWFKDAATWAAWFAFIAALFALPMSAEQLTLFQSCTGRTTPPSEIAREGWLVCGRRAGKSFVLALIAVFLAAFHSYAEYLAPGERGTVLIIAADRKQARVILRYIKALLNEVPMLSRLVERELQEGVDLTNGITIEIATCSWRTTRGHTIVAALCDELAFWSSEDSANPDFEVLNAIRPAMATIPSSMLLCASSPYARRGALWDAHRQHFGKDGDPILVWQADTRTMNTTVPQSFIDTEYERDPANAAAEFGAQFRTDIEGFVTRDVVEGCTSIGIHERAPVSEISYKAFADPAGGSGKDSFTLSIGHREGDVAVVDAIRERKPPFSPQDVVNEYAALLKSYNISKVIGDRYAGEWVREPFKAHQVEYDPAARPKSDIYRDVLPVLNSKKADLIDHPKLITQILGLERRTARSGKDSIDHAPNGHDDVANAVCGLIAHINSREFDYDTSLAWIGDDNFDTAEFRRSRMVNYLTGGRGFF